VLVVRSVVVSGPVVPEFELIPVDELEAVVVIVVVDELESTWPVVSPPLAVAESSPWHAVRMNSNVITQESRIAECLLLLLVACRRGLVRVQIQIS